MRLFWNECKKIWRPGILAILLLLGGLYYYCFPYFYIEYFCNGSYAQAEYDLLTAWVEEYGPTLEQEERAQLDTAYETYQNRFAQELAAIPGASDAGIVDYDTCQAFINSDTYEPDGLMTEIENLDSFILLSQFQYLLDWYDTNSAGLKEGEALSLLPDFFPSNTAGYSACLAVWCVLSAILLLSPTFVRDRLHRTRAMQCASRTGYKAARFQMAAGLVSVLILAAVNVAVYAIPFYSRGIDVFLDCPVSNTIVLTGDIMLDCTYGQYLLILAAVLGLATGAFALFLSRFSASYIAMMLKAVPLFLLLGCGYGYWLPNGTFYVRIWTGHTASIVPVWAESASLIALFSCGMALCVFSYVLSKPELQKMGDSSAELCGNAEYILRKAFASRFVRWCKSINSYEKREIRSVSCIHRWR